MFVLGCCPDLATGGDHLPYTRTLNGAAHWAVGSTVRLITEFSCIYQDYGDIVTVFDKNCCSSGNLFLTVTCPGQL